MKHFYRSLFLLSHLTLFACGNSSSPVLGVSPGGSSGGSGGGFTTPSAVDFGISPGSIVGVAQDNDYWYVIGSFTVSGQAAVHGFAEVSVSTGQIASGLCSLSSFDGGIQATVATTDAFYVGGNFTHYGSQSANAIAKINRADCTLDTTFNPPGANGFNNTVLTLVVNGSSLYVGGYFTAYRGVASSANYLAKLDLSSGAIDTSFSPPGASANGFDNTVNTLLANSGSLYVGGSFTAYKGVANSARRLAKLDLSTGAIDTTFSPPGASANGFDSSVGALAVSGSALYVGGSFSAYQGVANSALNLAKVDLTSGAIDTTFSPPGAGANGFDSYIKSLSVSGSALYVGGSFSSYRGVANSANNLAKLDLTTGAIDTTFSPPGATANGFNGMVQDLAVSGGSLFAIGSFSTYRNGTTTNRTLVRLDASTGALDNAWVQSNGGDINGPDNSAARLGFDGSNLIVAGNVAYLGGYTTNSIAKISKVTGLPDTTFSPPGNNGFNSTPSWIVMAGTALLTGGSFSTYRGVSVSDPVYIDSVTGALIP